MKKGFNCFTLPSIGVVSSGISARNGPWLRFALVERCIEDGSSINFLLSNADKILRQARSFSRPLACTHPQCSDNFLDIKVLPCLRYLLIKNRISSISEDVTVLPRMIKGSMLIFPGISFPHSLQKIIAYRFQWRNSKIAQ